jgi:hypothetical protein
MDINYQGKACVKKYTGTYNEAKDGTVREVDISIGLDKSQFMAAFGEELTDVVFSAFVYEMDDDDEQTDGVWKLKAPKPSKAVVCSHHKVDVEGDEIEVQPKIRAFIPVEDTEKVNAVIRLELGQAQVKLRRKLEDCVGVFVDLSIKPKQLSVEDAKAMGQQMTIIKGGVPTLSEGVPA